MPLSITPMQAMQALGGAGGELARLAHERPAGQDPAHDGVRVALVARVQVSQPGRRR